METQKTERECENRTGILSKLKIMDIQKMQEAYNRGLDDAENAIIEHVVALLNNKPVRKFANPKLDDLEQQIMARANTKEEKVEYVKVEGADFGPLFETMTVYDPFQRAVRDVLAGVEVDMTNMDESYKIILEIVKIRSDHYRSLGGRTKLGREFKKLNTEQLTSLNTVLN